MAEIPVENRMDPAGAQDRAVLEEEIGNLPDRLGQESWLDPGNVDDRKTHLSLLGLEFEACKEPLRPFNWGRDTIYNSNLNGKSHTKYLQEIKQNFILNPIPWRSEDNPSERVIQHPMLRADTSSTEFCKY